MIVMTNAIAKKIAIVMNMTNARMIVIAKKDIALAMAKIMNVIVKTVMRSLP